MFFELAPLQRYAGKYGLGLCQGPWRGRDETSVHIDAKFGIQANQMKLVLVDAIYNRVVHMVNTDVQ